MEFTSGQHVNLFSFIMYGCNQALCAIALFVALQFFYTWHTQDVKNVNRLIYLYQYPPANSG